MDSNRNIPKRRRRADDDDDAQEDEESIWLNLSLSLGPQQPPRRRQKQQRPPELPPPPTHHSSMLGHFLMPDASGSSWPLATTPQQSLFFQVPPPPQHNLLNLMMPLPHGEDVVSAGSFRSLRLQPSRSRVSGALNYKGKAETITPPYPWATDRRAVVHSYSFLKSKGLNKIAGEMQCKQCERRFEMQYDLEGKFTELLEFIAKNHSTMHDRAPKEWLNPVLPNCRHCKQANCVRPVPTKKKAINWLFLLLGQLLGCCKIDDLKYFCKHTCNHRTGAKDRVLYSTYMGLCRQLGSKEPFHM